MKVTARGVFPAPHPARGPAGEAGPQTLPGTQHKNDARPNPARPKMKTIKMSNKTKHKRDRVEEKCSFIWKERNFNVLIAHTCQVYVRGREQGCGRAWGTAARQGKGDVTGEEVSEGRPAPPTPVLQAQEYTRQDGTSRPLHHQQRSRVPVRGEAMRESP